MQNCMVLMVMSFALLKEICLNVDMHISLTLFKPTHQKVDNNYKQWK